MFIQIISIEPHDMFKYLQYVFLNLILIIIASLQRYI